MYYIVYILSVYPLLFVTLKVRSHLSLCIIGYKNHISIINAMLFQNIINKHLISINLVFPEYLNIIFDDKEKILKV